MFKAAFSPFSGEGGSGSGPLSYYDPNRDGALTMGKMVNLVKGRKKAIKEENLNPEYNYGESTGSFEASASSVDMSTLPVFDGRQANVPMMPPANSAANTPVFSPATQEKAASVYGTDNERQGAVSGFKQEAKDKIISELNNL